MRKTVLGFLAALLISATAASTAMAAGWRQDSYGWQYVHDDGSVTASNWEMISGKWYYFYNSGYMAHDTMIRDWYVGPDGAWVENAKPGDLLSLEGAEGGKFEKIGSRYRFTGTVSGYDAALIPEGEDWTAGIYPLTHGTFYVDENTKIEVQDKDFPAEGKTAVAWLDDYLARKKYWMELRIRVKGDHVEAITDIGSKC